jgi:alpha-amylase
MRKGYTGNQTITVLSNQGEKGSEYTLSLPDTGFTAGMKLTEIFTCKNITVDSSGIVSVPMAFGLPRVLYPTALLKGSMVGC